MCTGIYISDCEGPLTQLDRKVPISSPQGSCDPCLTLGKGIVCAAGAWRQYLGARKNGAGEEDTRVYLACLVVYAHITFIGLFLRLTRGPPYICMVLNREIALWSSLVPIALPVDYEQSLFFLGPWSKTPDKRKWPFAWLKAREGALVSCVPRLRHSTLVRACTPHTKSEEKERLPAVYFSGEALWTRPRLAVRLYYCKCMLLLCSFSCCNAECIFYCFLKSSETNRN